MYINVYIYIYVDVNHQQEMNIITQYQGPKQPLLVCRAAHASWPEHLLQCLAESVVYRRSRSEDWNSLGKSELNNKCLKLTIGP